MKATQGEWLPPVKSLRRNDKAEWPMVHGSYVGDNGEWRRPNGSYHANDRVRWCKMKPVETRVDFARV
jgi:hypothetical protein